MTWCHCRGIARCPAMAVCFCVGTARWIQHCDNPMSTALPRSWLLRIIFGVDLASCPNSLILSYMWITTTKTISGKLFAISFAATMRLLLNYLWLMMTRTIGQRQLHSDLKFCVISYNIKCSFCPFDNCVVLGQIWLMPWRRQPNEIITGFHSSVSDILARYTIAFFPYNNLSTLPTLNLLSTVLPQSGPRHIIFWWWFGLFSNSLICCSIF